MEADTSEEEYEITCCVRGYHIYRQVWGASIGETLVCEREQANDKDRYAVAVIKAGRIVGHLPRKMSRMCSLFLRRGGTIVCTVLGGKRYSFDLLQGGLEIPCSLLFKGQQKDIKNLKSLRSRSHH